MALEDFEPVEDGPSARARLCSEQDCEQVAVVGNPYTGAFAPLCFGHAFEAALDEDDEAQRKAMVWAVRTLDGIDAITGEQREAKA